MQPHTHKEECYFCGRSEDDEGVWLKPFHDEFICEECEEEQARKKAGPDPYDEWRERQWAKADDPYDDDYDY